MMPWSSWLCRECQLSDGIPSACFHLISQRQRPRCIRAAHHTWPHFLLLTTTCPASKGTNTGRVISSNANIRTQVTWEGPGAAAVILILSDSPPARQKHLSGSKSSFRSPLILLEYFLKVGRRWRKRGLLWSLFTAWIKSVLICHEKWD